MKSKLTVANIVASSSTSAWSQTYHAGGVTALVCVRQREGEKTSSLSLVGKDLLNTFESEYFTLETKNLAAIKDAVSLTYNKSKDTHDISLLVAAVIQNAVYVVLAGDGKILLVRNNTLATLLEQEGEDVLAASGFLENGDSMVLATLSFAKLVSSATILDTLEENTTPDAAEILSPMIHKENDGSASALIFSYAEDGEKLSEAEPAPASPESKNDEEEPTVSAPPISRKKIAITHRQKIFLTIAVILAIVFIGAIYFSLQKKQTSQNSTLFLQVYPPALSKYQEGQGLEGLNSSLAHDDFQQAQSMLQSAKGKFPAGSSEENQILALLNKVNAKLIPTVPPQQQTNVTKVNTGTDAFLDFAAGQSGVKYFAMDDSNYYFANDAGITKTPQSGGKGKQIITNGGGWKSLGGFATYLGNMYILDTKDGIDKYAGTSSGFGNKAAYFSGSAPDLSKAVSITIDGSIWILSSGGSIVEYTKGAQDSFTMTGLTQSLSSPTQIVTSVDDNNVYILDNGNSRLVVLKKDGTFVAEYVNDIFKSAIQLDIQESAKKAFTLSNGSIYELDMK